MKRKRELGPPLSAFAARRQAAELAAQQQLDQVKATSETPVGTQSSEDLSTSPSDADEQQDANRFAVLGSVEVHASRSKNVAEAESTTAFLAKTFKTEECTILGLSVDEVRLSRMLSSI